jgi:hypothetical protein
MKELKVARAILEGGGARDDESTPSS